MNMGKDVVNVEKKYLEEKSIQGKISKGKMSKISSNETFFLCDIIITL